MELKDFISETPSQLIEGVIEAQTKVLNPGSSGGRVTQVRNPDTKPLHGVTNDNFPAVFVDFDISQ